jgi:surfeit locus 1 family protein
MCIDRWGSEGPGPPPYPGLVPALLAPRYWANHLLLVVLLVAAGWLGLWQYDGWQARREAEARDLTQVAPIPLADAIGPDDPFPGELVGQPVEVHGAYVGNTFWISGRQHEGQDGYWVVDPVRVAGSVLPVVRGWEATPSWGQRGPEPRGAVDLVGGLQPSESAGVSDDDPGDNVLPQLRVADLAQHFDEDLYGAYVVARQPGQHPDGLVQADLQQLPDASRFTAIRNLLYAIEWWFFGAFALFVWWRWVRDTTARLPAGASTEEPVPDGEHPRTR